MVLEPTSMTAWGVTLSLVLCIGYPRFPDPVLELGAIHGPCSCQGQAAVHSLQLLALLSLFRGESSLCYAYLDTGESKPSLVTQG